MAILGIGLAGVAATTAFISEHVRLNHNRFLAASLAELVMEEVRSFGCDPNAANDACERLVTRYNSPNNPNNPKMYCWTTKNGPREITNDDKCDGDGHLFQASIHVTTPRTQATLGANSIGYERARLTAGVLPAVGVDDIVLDNIANVRVTIRWNDVRWDNAIIGNKTPRFFVYQTRVTQ